MNKTKFAITELHKKLLKNSPCSYFHYSSLCRKEPLEMGKNKINKKIK